MPDLFEDGLPARVNALEARFEIEEFILAYFGYGRTPAHGSYSEFFADEPHFNINGVICTSKDELPALYRRVGSFMPKRTGKYHMQITNFIIRVNGDRARVQFLWTQQINRDPKGVPEFTEQGREFDELVRIDGRWKFKKRVLISDSGLIDCFDGTWQQRDDFALDDLGAWP